MKRVFVLWLMAWLAGCAAMPERQCAKLHAEVMYCLQPVEAMGDVSALQQVDFKFPQHSNTVLVEFETEGQAFTIAVLTPMGHKLMQYKYMPSEIISLGGLLTKFDPVLLAALVQLSVWPSQSVTNGLRGKFEWTATQDHRWLRTEGKTLLDIAMHGQQPVPDTLLIQLPLQHIELHIQTLQQALHQTLPP